MSIEPMSIGPMISDSEYKRICWASRRGMLELDLILVPFVENRFLTLSHADQQLYIRLLEQEDNEMFTWFLGRERPADQQLAKIVDQIIAHNREAKKQ